MNKIKKLKKINKNITNKNKYRITKAINKMGIVV
jgi:hypothetical protein